MRLGKLTGIVVFATGRARHRIQGPRTLKNYELGRLPRLEVLVRLAGMFEVSVEWILVEAGNKKYH
jgi:hypothetical protein